ncbi:MAG: hypothetical protein P9L89_00040 [Candidatus Celaenobacter polaris]|nr:hypothetical protein [Candidatus Celaenobacter polaris]
MEVLINKLVFIFKKVEVMVKEKIAMLMSKLGLKPVLSHNLLTGYTPRGILLTSKLGF